ncbi:MAG: iron ABC transporter permease [Bacteroidota bacterium]
MNKGKNADFKWLWLAVALVALFFLRLFFGSVHVPAAEIFSNELVLKFRLPIAVTCVLAGSALAVSGLLMQTLFRNALAGPDVLGLTSGSSLMVAILILAGNGFSMTFATPWTLAIAASVGAAGVFLLILLISQYVNDNTSLLIIGLMIGATTASVVGVLQYVSRAEDLQAFMIWGLGSVGSTNWNEIIVLSVIAIAGTILSLINMKSLNALLLGENYASTVGVSVKRSRLLILTSASILVGGVTAFCGPIAFVGLAVPHLVRIIIPTTNHKVLLPSVFLGGGVLLLFCDIIAQLPGSTQVLPLNAVTSMVGAPVVIWLIIKNRKVNI